MSIENLLIALAVLAAIFINGIRPWIGKRRADEQADEAGSDVAAPRVRSIPSPSSTAGGAVPRQAPARSRVLVPATMPATMSRERRRKPVKNLADVRKGIVLSAILGPCRALDQSDSTSR